MTWTTTPWFTLADTPFTPLALAALVGCVAVVWWIGARIERAVHDLASRRPDTAANAPVVYLWGRIVRYTIWVVGTLAAMSALGFDLTNLAFLGGAIGVGIGLGLQNVFSNFIGGIVLLIERTLKLRDFVELQSGVRGQVREIALRYTRITTNDDVDVLVPNAEFVTGRVTNWTYDSRVRRVHVRFTVPRTVDKDAVRATVVAAARALPHTVDDPEHPLDVWIVGLSDAELQLELVAWVGPERVGRPDEAQAEYLWAIDDALRTLPTP
ncbi:MAG: mechanosensitive ion channel domain-containing protein [Myxococcota bacterium]